MGHTAWRTTVSRCAALPERHGVSAPAGRSFARFCAVFRESVKKIRCRSAAAGGSGYSRRVPGFPPRCARTSPCRTWSVGSARPRSRAISSHASPTRTAFRSRVPRAGAAFGRRAEVPRVRSPADYDGARVLTRLLAGRERGCPPRRGPPRLARVESRARVRAGRCDGRLFAQHAIEMFRRSLPDGPPRHCLDRLSNRLTKILAQTRRLSPSA